MFAATVSARSSCSQVGVFMVLLILMMGEMEEVVGSQSSGPAARGRRLSGANQQPSGQGRRRRLSAGNQLFQRRQRRRSEWSVADAGRRAREKEEDKEGEGTSSFTATGSHLWVGGRQWDLEDGFVVRESLAPETKELLKALRPCGTCTNYERFGEEHDGGYILCSEHLDNSIVAGFSFGVNGFDGWGSEVSQRLGGIPVHEYDCFNLKEPSCPKGSSCRLIFHPECLADSTTASKPNFKSLHEQLLANSPAPAKSSAEPGAESSPTGSGDLLLKVDTEGAEWGAFAEAQEQDMRRFRQVVVEFHSLEKKAKHAQYLKAVKRILDSGFLVVHIHGNNFGAMGEFFGGASTKYMLPTVLEVTFLNRAALKGAPMNCDTTPELLPQDAPNDMKRPDLVGFRLPSLLQRQQHPNRQQKN